MNRTETRPVGGSGAARVLESWKLAGTLVRFAELLREESGRDEDLCRKAYKSGKADGLAFARELLLEFSEKGDVSGVGADGAWDPGSRVVAVSPAAWRISWRSWPE